MLHLLICRVLTEQIAEGQPRMHRPWKKIIVVVQGIYRMEGELCELPEIVSVLGGSTVIWGNASSPGVNLVFGEGLTSKFGLKCFGLNFLRSRYGIPYRVYEYLFGSVPVILMQDAIHTPLRNYRPNPMRKDLVDTDRLNILFHERKDTESVCESDCEKTPLKPLTSKLSTYEILGPGIILLRNYVSIKDQVDTVNMCSKWGMGPGGFYKPAGIQRYIMCLGRNWDPITRYEKRYLSDGSEPPPPLPLPCELVSLNEATIQDAQAHLTELPSMRPDMCLVNFYYRNCLDELHEDRDESDDSITRGLPVVTISLGELALFKYGHTRDEKKLQDVFLESGDVLIFGGKSRLLYHGVTQVGQYTAPSELLDEIGTIRGHLSLTFKQI
ncbi:DNA N(6)-methyladenine demethylase ALKBH1C-like [Bidens hawaiensis]|uniref:DNA N(6)-methyladenine demethylase ALKBH1C-like n=1 Tax=Bidens hawaiensis TaxID=980011 RepID=UPI00404AC8DF